MPTYTIFVHFWNQNTKTSFWTLIWITVHITSRGVNFFFGCFATLNKIDLTLCNFELSNIFWGHLITQLKVLLYFILEKKTKKNIWFLNLFFISLGNWALVGLMCQPKVSSLFSILLWNLKPKMLVCSASFTYWIAGIQMVSVIHMEVTRAACLE